MKFSLLCVFLLIAVSLIDKSEGASTSQKKAVCRVVCFIACRQACEVCTQTCGPICLQACHEKRTALSESYPLPCDFAAWDKSGDGHVDMEEFSSVGYPTIQKGDLALVFQAIDTDGNSIISKTEMPLPPPLLLPLLHSAHRSTIFSHTLANTPISHPFSLHITHQCPTVSLHIITDLTNLSDLVDLLPLALPPPLDFPLPLLEPPQEALVDF